MNKNSKQSVHEGEESSKASATNPSLTQTMVRIILHPIYPAFIEPDPLRFYADSATFVSSDGSKQTLS
jgi:hypothetical protein